MSVGTKTVLWGAHAFWLHPWLLALAWLRLFGVPWDPRLWVSFVVHDLGYWGRGDVEGAEGEGHVELGARIMRALFGQSWGDFVAAHSRYWAKRNGRQVSRLCVADKLAFVMTPDWLYLLMTKATGELHEYMAKSRDRQAGGRFTPEELSQVASSSPQVWLRGLKSYTRRWIEEHRDGRADSWTPVPVPQSSLDTAV